jgi:hypothetical protein
MADIVRSPGWYPDPDRGPGERWWNGVSWSDSRRGANGVSTAASTNISAQAPITRVVYSAANPAPQSPADHGHQAAALTVTRALNPAATTAFAAAVISIFLNFLLIPSIVAIIFGVRAVARANQLVAEGQPVAVGTKILGIISIVIAIGSAVSWIVFFLIAFVSGA